MLNEKEITLQSFCVLHIIIQTLGKGFYSKKTKIQVRSRPIYSTGIQGWIQNFGKRGRGGCTGIAVTHSIWHLHFKDWQ